jgi:hypothetical protein
VAHFLGRSLPDHLDGARSQTLGQGGRAPANKLQRFLGPSPTRCCTHSAQLSIEGVIARREVLTVDGAMAQWGSKLMQILLRLVFAALQRRQELARVPRAERRGGRSVATFTHGLSNARVEATNTPSA